MLSIIETNLLGEYGDDIQQLLKAIFDYRDQIENLESKLEKDDEKISELEEKINDLEK